jgi:hypothetical protein
VWGKELNAKDIHHEMFPLCCGKCVSNKAVQPWWQIFADEGVETELLKWLRQQSKDFYAAGLNAQIKRRDSFITVVDDMSRNKCFSFHVRISHVLLVISICDIFTDSPS